MTYQKELPAQLLDLAVKHGYQHIDAVNPKVHPVIHAMYHPKGNMDTDLKFPTKVGVLPDEAERFSHALEVLGKLEGWPTVTPGQQLLCQLTA